MATIVLTGVRAVPKRLEELGYAFAHPRARAGAPRRPVVTHVIEREQLVARELPEVFEFFSRARNLESLTPPWLSFSVLTPEPIEMRPGTLIDYRLRLHGLPMRWRTLIEAWEPEVRFVDRQLRGPYKLWHHTHSFAEVSGGTARPRPRPLRDPARPGGRTRAPAVRRP